MIEDQQALADRVCVGGFRLAYCHFGSLLMFFDLIVLLLFDQSKHYYKQLSLNGY